MKNRNRTLAFGALGMVLLILDSHCAAVSAAEGVELCIKTVVPALFPFFVLSILVTGSIRGRSGGTPFGRLLGISAEEEVIVFTGLLGGYPIGAQSAAEAYGAGRISQGQANRLIMFCSQAGPSFLFGMVGQQFDTMKSVWFLWAVQILSAASVAMLIPPENGAAQGGNVVSTISTGAAMKKAVAAMGAVCGWVVLFRVVIGFLQRWIFWLLPENIQILFSGILELTNGCLMLRSIADERLRFLVAAILLNFGGICVVLQTASVANILSMGRYLTGKALQAGFATLFALAIYDPICLIFPIMILLTGRLLQKTRKNSSIRRLVDV